MSAIAVCGEAVIDLVATSTATERAYVPRPGGSPLNVAIGLGRLDVPTAFVGRLSEDRFGARLRAHLADSGVDLSHVSSGTEPTALAFVDHDAAGEPSYEFRWDDTADRALGPEDLPRDLGGVGALHVGSVSTHLTPVARTLRDLVERQRSDHVISYDPNIRPALIGDRASHKTLVERWVTLADVVKLSSTDLDWLHPRQDAGEVALRWLALGPTLVVVTRGARGAVAYADGVVVEVPGAPVQVRDTVGAGDAFTAGLLAALHEGGSLDRRGLRELSAADLRTALTFAARIAGRTCTRVGADPPRRNELA